MLGRTASTACDWGPPSESKERKEAYRCFIRTLSPFETLFSPRQQFASPPLYFASSGPSKSLRWQKGIMEIEKEVKKVSLDLGGVTPFPKVRRLSGRWQKKVMADIRLGILFGCIVWVDFLN